MQWQQPTLSVRTIMPSLVCIQKFPRFPFNKKSTTLLLFPTKVWCGALHECHASGKTNRQENLSGWTFHIAKIVQAKSRKRWAYSYFMPRRSHLRNMQRKTKKLKLANIFIRIWKNGQKCTRMGRKVMIESALIAGHLSSSFPPWWCCRTSVWGLSHSLLRWNELSGTFCHLPLRKHRQDTKESRVRHWVHVWNGISFPQIGVYGFPPSVRHSGTYWCLWYWGKRYIDPRRTNDVWGRASGRDVSPIAVWPSSDAPRRAYRI